jgi:hypothetical protein
MNKSPILYAVTGPDASKIPDICHANGLRAVLLVTRPFRELKKSEWGNRELCIEVDKYNLKVLAHNRTICDIVNRNIRQNLHIRSVTVPTPMYNYENEHNVWMKEMTVNPANRVRRAVEWLSERGLEPLKDYAMDDATDIADRMCYDETIAQYRSRKDPIIVQLLNLKPFQWDGKTPHPVPGGVIDWAPVDAKFNFLHPKLQYAFIGTDENKM